MWCALHDPVPPKWSDFGIYDQHSKYSRPDDTLIAVITFQRDVINTSGKEDLVLKLKEFIQAPSLGRITVVEGISLATLYMEWKDRDYYWTAAKMFLMNGHRVLVCCRLIYADFCKDDLPTDPTMTWDAAAAEKALVRRVRELIENWSGADVNIPPYIVAQKSYALEHYWHTDAGKKLSRWLYTKYRGYYNLTYGEELSKERKRYANCV